VLHKLVAADDVEIDPVLEELAASPELISQMVPEPFSA